MRELIHNVTHDELEGNDFATPTSELAELQKVGGQDHGRLAFEQFFGPPKVDVVALTLMQKVASVADLELYKAAEIAYPQNPIGLYEELGGGYKLAGSLDRAKGLSRVGELLSGSRAKALGEAKKHHVREAGAALPQALKYDQSKVTPSVLKAVHEGSTHTLPYEKQKVVDHAQQAHQNITHGRKAERIGKVLSAEESKVRAARGGAVAAGAATIAGGVAAARHKDSNKK